MFLKNQKRTLAFLLALILMLTTFMSVAVFPASADGDANFGVKYQTGVDDNGKPTYSAETYFGTLSAALSGTAATEGRVITVLPKYDAENDVYIRSLDYNENCTIPSGTTLLIPFDDDHTLYDYSSFTFGDDGSVNYGDFLTSEFAPPEAYMTLTMTGNSSLTVAPGGAICLGGRMCSSSSESTVEKTRNQGVPTGPDGRIHMTDTSKITVQNGGVLYTWGFIYGEGTNVQVEAESGATVSELFQARGWRGFRTSYNYIEGLLPGHESKATTFPFNQYYVQNIEVPLKINSGANEILAAAVVGAGTTINFIGDGGMFQIEDDGYLIKDYDEVTDRLNIEAYCEATLGELAVSIGGHTLGTSLFDYLPISNNITIDIKEGSSVNVAENVALLPGSELKVDKDATVVVSEDTNVFVMSAEDWVDEYAQDGTEETSPIVAVGYTAAGAPTVDRTETALVDADVDINGKAEIYGGFLTRDIDVEGGTSNVHSSQGTGEIKYCADTASEDVYFANGDTGLSEVSFVAAYIKTGDDYYGLTDEGDAGVYSLGTNGVTLAEPMYTVLWKDGNPKHTKIADKAYCEGETPVFPGPMPMTYGECIGWTTVRGGTEVEIPYGRPFPAVSASDADENGNITYYAVYKALPTGGTYFGQHSLTTDGTIGVNFYVMLPAYANVEDYSVDFSWGKKFISSDPYTYDNNTPYTLENVACSADEIVETDEYTQVKYTVQIAAKELNDTITAKLMKNGEADPVATDTYSGADYAYKALNMSDEQFQTLLGLNSEAAAKLRALVISILNYCSAAQDQFDYNTNAHANDCLTATQKKLPTVRTNSIADPAASVAGYTYYGASANLGFDTAYTVYFLKPEGSTADPQVSYYGFDWGWHSFEDDDFASNDYAFRCTVSHIPAPKILDDITLKIDNMEYTINMKTYIKNVLSNSSASAELVNTAKALYDFGTKAKAFFG